MSRYCCGFIPPEDSWETLLNTSQGHPPQGVRKLGYWSTKSYSKLAEGYLRGGEYSPSTASLPHALAEHTPAARQSRCLWKQAISTYSNSEV